MESISEETLIEDEVIDWDDHYTAIHESVLNYWGEMDQINNRHLWAVIEGDSGALWCSESWHVVNRLGYVISAEPRKPEHVDKDLLWSKAPDDFD